MKDEKKPLSVLSNKEQRLNKLILGFAKPITESEKQFVKEVKEIHAKGRVAELPNDIF